MIEEKTLIKLLYVRFMENELNKIKNTEGAHIHPAPAMVEVYQTILENMKSVEETNDDKFIISEDDLTCAMDFVARFASELATRGRPYDDLETCDCFSITDKDLQDMQGEVI